MMKIQLIDSMTTKPLANTTVQLQIKDTGGAQRYTSDGSGFITLKDEYKGKQISLSPTGEGQWYTLSDNLKLTYDVNETEYTSGYGK